MGNQGIGLVVAGNELNKVETIKSLAKTVATSQNVIGQVVGNGMLANAEAIANTPAYTEAVEVLAGYLQKMVEEKTDEDAFTPLPDDEDEDNDDLCHCPDCVKARAVVEAEDEDEDEELTCDRCGEVFDEDDDEGDYVPNAEYNADDVFVCYDCMTATEYKGLS